MPDQLDNQTRIQDWIERYAPGVDTICPFLRPQVLHAEHTTITAVIDEPYGLQFNRSVSDGAAKGEYASHVSRPGATVTLVSPDWVVMQREFRDELGQHVLKFAGGFTGDFAAMADIVQGYPLVRAGGSSSKLPLDSLSSGGEGLRNHFTKVVKREYDLEIGDWPISLVAAPVGYPAIFITSVMGIVEVSNKVFMEAAGHLSRVNQATKLDELEGPFAYPHRYIDLEDVLQDFGDQNSELLASWLARNGD